MKRHPKFKLMLEDESRLRPVFNFRMTRIGLFFAVFIFIALSLILSGLIIVSTPLKTLLPGYMKQSERSATQENILRLDSIQNHFNANQAFLQSVLRSLDTERIPEDSLIPALEAREMSSDSLLPASPLEKKFVSTMEERERYNLSVLAPLAAEGMMFSPACDSGVFTAASRNSQQADLLMVNEEVLRSVADGSILASFYSPGERGFVILIQHSKGFISRFEGTGSPMVEAGDNVLSGQMIALAPGADSKGRRIVRIRMWHNGLPLIPFDYIGSSSASTQTDDKYEAPRGR